MTAAVVHCPSCEQPSRVPAAALGLTVECPRCDEHFVAVASVAPARPASPLPRPRPKADDIPVVQRLPNRRAPRPPADVDHDDVPTVHPTRATGGPFALALLPLGVPVLWLILTLAVQPSEFSFMAAVAIALGTMGLGLGLAGLRRWSVGLRTRLLLALTLLTYTSAALFYFAHPDWLERVREVAAVTGLLWREFRPEDCSFRLEVPGEPQESVPPVPDWNLTARQFVDPKNAVDLYVVAYGNPPVGLGRGKVDDAWFATARDAIAAACDGQLLDERVVSVPHCEARQYVYELAAGRRRVVRVVRDDKKLFYLGVEGPYLSPERADVQRYLKSFKLIPVNKR